MTDDIAEILPRKMRLKDDIHEYLQQRTELFTLYRIIEQRQNVVTSFQIESCDERLHSIVKEIRLQLNQRHKQEKESELKVINIQNISSLCLKVKNSRNEVLEAMPTNQLNKSSSTPPFTKYLALTESVNEVNNGLEQLCMNVATDESYEAELWKELLSGDDKEEHADFLKTILGEAENLSNSLNNFRNTLDDELQETTQKMGKFNLEEEHKNQQKFLSTELKQVKGELKIKENIFKNHAEVKTIKEKNSSVAYSIQLTKCYGELLMTIDDLLKQHDSLVHNYIGPVFQFLDPTLVEKVDQKLWNQIKNVVEIILFKTKHAANTINDFLFEIRANVSCTFLGLDEFVASDIEHPSDEIYTSLKSLLKQDIDPKCSEILPYVLGNYLLVNHSDAFDEKVNADLKSFNITCYDEVVSTTYQDGSTSIVSQLPTEAWNTANTSPLTLCQKLLQRTQRRNALMKHNAELESIRENAEAAVNLEREKLQNNLSKQIIHYVDASKRASVLKLCKLYLDNESDEKHLQKLRELLNEEDTSKWNTKKIKKSLQIAPLPSPDFRSLIELESLNPFVYQIEPSMMRIYDNLSEEARKNNEEANKKKLSLQEDFIKNMTQNLMVYHNSVQDLSTSNDSHLQGLEKKMELQESCSKLGIAYARKNIAQNVAKSINDGDGFKRDPALLLNDALLNEFQNKSTDEITKQIDRCYKKIVKQKSEKGERFLNITPKTYVSLVDVIDKARDFVREDVLIPQDIRKQAFPFLNAVVVKQLKDAIHSYKVSFNTIFCEYIQQASLFFYTHGSIIEKYQDDKFDWNCFDMTRIKSMDFAEKWKEGYEMIISTKKLRQIKSFLLILHIINYSSLFKFIIVHASIFKVVIDNFKLFFEHFIIFFTGLECQLGTKASGIPHDNFNIRTNHNFRRSASGINAIKFYFRYFLTFF